LGSITTWGYSECLVISPPSTHSAWQALGAQLGVDVTTMSHAKFRMKDTKLSRKVPLIADEMHLFGGQQGQGWKKLDTLARHLEAPLVLASATPNYNDAERVYCIQHVLDPKSVPGGYLQFLYTHCVTQQNPFSMQPDVLGFRNHKDAAEYLAALPGVFYLPDDTVITIDDVPYIEYVPSEMRDYGYNRRKKRMIASIIELTHTVRIQGLTDHRAYIRPAVLDEIMARIGDDPVLIFANHSTIVEALARTFAKTGQPAAFVTGDTPAGRKEQLIQEFREGKHHVLVGTATLATGTDGLDRVCDTLLILDDTDDDALRRQLIGRIMPRGDRTNVASKKIYRFVPT
jgi:superfamily II DNA or RNA helicase